MSERISVTISAQDGASKTFAAIGTSAQKMGDSIEKAGTEGTQGLKTIDTQAKTTARSMDDIKAKATALGAAFGTLVSAAALLGASYRDQERQIDGINRLYGEQADEILLVSENIQDMTKFSNDAARESLLLASSLVTNYGLSADQMEILVERSADLAQIHGFDLPDAMSRTAGALRGEGEAAERLGLNMSDAAVAAAALDAGITSWNVPGALTEAERAAFRFQVFMEQTESVTGAAAAAADTAGGSFRQFANDVQDAGQRVGGLLGPIGQVAAEMAPLAVAAPIVAAGMANVGASFIGTAAGARLLSIALSPITGKLTAIGAVLGAGYLAWKVYNEALNEAGTAYDNLAESENNYRMSGQDSIADNFAAASASVKEFEATLLEISKQYTTSSGFINMQLPTRSTWDKAVNSINDALNDTRVDQEEYLAWVEEQWAAAAAIVSDPALFKANPSIVTDTINRINDVDLTQFRVEAEAAAEAADGLAQSLSLLDIDMYGQIAQAQAVGREYSDLVKNVEAFEDATQDWLANSGQILDFWLQYQEGIRNTWSEYGRLKGAAMEAGTGLPMAPTDSVSAVEQAFEATVRLAAALADAGAELDSVLATYSQIDALGQRSAASGSIAENLIGTPGEWAVIDDLLESGAVSLAQYNQALGAGYSIQQSNLRVQEDLNTIRAAQLPLLEQSQLAYEANIDRISQMGAAEQRMTLALQDTAVQQQIATQYATAYSASLGEIPEEVATRMIVESAEADPMLKDILLNLGLISETEGIITVNFPDGPTVQESVMALTESIDALVFAITGIPVIHIDAETDDALSGISSVQQHILNLDGQNATVTTNTTDNATPVINQVSSVLTALNGDTATTTANTVDNSSGVLSSITNMLSALNGKVATSYVKTVYSASGTRELPFAMGGIPGFASGGVMFRGAEAGPEVLHFAGGGSTPIYHDGIYSAPPNTYVSPANANPGLSGGGMHVNVYVSGSITTERALTANITREIANGIRDDLIRHQTAAGMV
jgi:hypothetical protein